MWQCYIFLLFGSYNIQYQQMYSRKNWSAQEDQHIRCLMKKNQRKGHHEKMKWKDIAQSLNTNLPDSNRSAKQCRQRWCNQLDPNINLSLFSQKEISKIISLHNKIGNKWAAIAREIEGRTDNSIKNFFYCSLRKSLRLVNFYLSKYKKKSNIKPFQATILTKILTVKDEKYKERLNIKANAAIQLADQLKNMLLKLSLEVDEQNIITTQQDKDFYEKIIKCIQDFNKSCKKKKQKKCMDYQKKARKCAQNKSTITVQKIQSNRKQSDQKKQEIIKGEINFSNNDKVTETVKIPKIIKPDNLQVMSPFAFFQQNKQSIATAVGDKPPHNILGFVNMHQLVSSQQFGRMQQSPFDFRKRSMNYRMDQKQSVNGNKQYFFDCKNSIDPFSFGGGGIFWKKKQSCTDNPLQRSQCFDPNINPAMFASINIGDRLGEVNPELIESQIFKEI